MHSCQAELERTREERDRFAGELANMKREAEENWASERVENALLRERINDVAAEVARLASTLEGPNSPIDAILAAEGARDRAAPVAVTVMAPLTSPSRRRSAAISPTACARCRRRPRVARSTTPRHGIKSDFRRPGRAGTARSA